MKNENELKKLKSIVRDLYFDIENKSSKKMIALHINELNDFVLTIDDITIKN